MRVFHHDWQIVHIINSQELHIIKLKRIVYARLRRDDIQAQSA